MSTSEPLTGIAKRLGQFLQEKNVTKASLAKKLNMWQPTVNAYFLNTSCGRSMPLSFLESVVSLFPDLDAEWLLRGTPTPSVSINGNDNIGNGNNNNVTFTSESRKELEAEIKRLRDQNTMLTKTNATLTAMIAKVQG